MILEGTNISTNAPKLQFATNQYQNTLLWVTYITLAIHYITPVHRVKTVTLRRTHTTILTTTILGTLQLRQSQLHRQSPQHRQSLMDTTVTTTTTAVLNTKQHSSAHQDSRWILHILQSTNILVILVIHCLLVIHFSSVSTAILVSIRLITLR